MAEKKEKSEAQLKREVAEKLWLNYFNHALYAQGVITETERNRMQNLISSRNPSPPQQSKF